MDKSADNNNSSTLVDEAPLSPIIATDPSSDSLSVGSPGSFRDSRRSRLTERITRMKRAHRSNNSSDGISEQQSAEDAPKTDECLSPSSTHSTTAAKSNNSTLSPKSSDNNRVTTRSSRLSSKFFSNRFSATDDPPSTMPSSSEDKPPSAEPTSPSGPTVHTSPTSLLASPPSNSKSPGRTPRVAAILHEVSSPESASSPSAYLSSPRSPIYSRRPGWSGSDGTPKSTDRIDAIRQTLLSQPDLRSPATASSATAAGSPKRHVRVPGGAAAKIILLGPRKNSDEEEEGTGDVSSPTASRLDNSLGHGASPPTSESGPNLDDSDGVPLDGARLNATQTTSTDGETDIEQNGIKETIDKVKTEFSVGTEMNRRYTHPPPTIPEQMGGGDSDGEGGPAEQNSDAAVNDTDSVMTTSLFNRSEVFHQTAAAAVTALLCPTRPSGSGRHGGGVSSSASVAGDVSVMSIPHNVSDNVSVMSTAQSVTSAFQTPKTDMYGGDSPAAYESLARRDVSQTLISKDVEQKLDGMKGMMRDPNKTMADLLQAINTPEGVMPGGQESNYLGDEEEEEDDAETQAAPPCMDVGYMVRRKNACGALQLLTSTKKNRVKICWTVGVLSALTSVLRDTGERCPLRVRFPEKRLRREFEAARDRAVACLMNLSMPPQNRIAVFHTPYLAHSLLLVIREGQGVPRKGCCAILALLSKSVDNRLLMVQVPGLIDTLTMVIKPRPRCVEKVDGDKQKDSHNESDNSSAEGQNSESGNRKNRKGPGAIKQKPSALSESSKMASVQPSYSQDSTDTPRLTGGHSPVELSGYDDTANDLLRDARQNVFAALGHFVKEKDNAYHFARHAGLIATLCEISGFHDSPSHILAVQFLASCTRHRLNTKVLVFKHRMLVSALVEATHSPFDETRLYACYGLQNLAQDKSCRQELAVTHGLITALCDRSRKASHEAERLAAISALKNLCDEPANLIPMSNTPDCVATLMHLAHGKEAGVTQTMQYRACDALATLSHWLRKIATSGQSMEAARLGTRPTAGVSSASSSVGTSAASSSSRGLFVPSLRVVTWNQWQ